MVIFAECVGFADQRGGDYSMIRRREFVAGIGGAVGWPLLVSAQQRKKPIIDWLDLLVLGQPDQRADDCRITPLKRR
jgi:hypothetical protein